MSDVIFLLLATISIISCLITMLVTAAIVCLALRIRVAYWTMKKNKKLWKEFIAWCVENNRTFS